MPIVIKKPQGKLAKFGEKLGLFEPDPIDFINPLSAPLGLAVKAGKKAAGMSKVGKKLLGKETATKGAGKGRKLFHVTQKNFENFDPKMGNDGTIWFTGDMKEVAEAATGAAMRPGIPAKVIEARIKEGVKLAPAELADKLTIDQLIAKGYRGVHYPKESYGADNFQMFFPDEDIVKVGEQFLKSMKMNK